MKQKIQTLLKELNQGLVEREQTLKAALLSVLAGENIVLIGPPGTGKSLIARRIAEGLQQDSDYFEYLLTKFSTPEEIFGPLSISELKQDNFKRNTAGYLPSVKIAFLDEIFKASSSILNALLTILNERLYHNGASAEPVPLQALIAASNELPTDQEELNALYDRFLVRVFVDYVSEKNLVRLFDHTAPPNITTSITAQDLTQIKSAVYLVSIPKNIAEAIQSIWLQHKDTFKEDRRETLSDRRLKKVLHLLRVSAVTNGRFELNLSDVLLLKDCLWNHPDNALKVRELILKTLQRYSRKVPQTQALENLPEYEFDDDGNIIPLTSEQARASRARHAPTTNNVVGEAHSRDFSREKTAQLHAKERGYKGLGTASDPILIENAQDLMGLDVIGAKGYYFLQTADIDCSALTTWATIHLQGHYDGSGHFIQNSNSRGSTLFQQIQEQSSIKYNKGDNVLFQNIQAQSSVTNLELRGLNLAKNVAASHIEWCKSDKSLIDDNATDCTITACQSGSSLILNMVKNCTIRDCSLVMYEVYNVLSSMVWVGRDVSKDRNLDGISRTLINSSVERCLVTGQIKLRSYDYKFYGVTRTCDASTIRQCAIGRVKLEDAGWGGRITKDIQNNSTLENNISIDSNSATQNDEKKDGKSISAALWNQRTFEHTLGWDFNNVWQWDDQKDHPVLRSVGVHAKTQTPKPTTTPQTNTVDLLTQQIRANIWL
jgi:MoxR-like ATPase